MLIPRPKTCLLDSVSSRGQTLEKPYFGRNGRKNNCGGQKIGRRGQKINRGDLKVSHGGQKISRGSRKIRRRGRKISRVMVEKFHILARGSSRTKLQHGSRKVAT